ncbi:MAG TPA: FixH family protein [Syntrophorhabdaceae bacterium]|nr:FixH family protein [Syntrophorhabdaceae bacterium]
MKTLTIIMIAVFLVVGIVYAKDYEVNKKAGNYSVAVKINKNPPVVGKNNVDISIIDASGKAVTDAAVAIELSMAPMPGMPAANYKSNAELKGKTYKTVIEPSMAGPWTLAIKITKDGKTETAKLSLDVK